MTPICDLIRTYAAHAPQPMRGGFPISSVNNASHCNSFIILRSWLKYALYSLARGGSRVLEELGGGGRGEGDLSAGEVEKDKPVANIAAYGVIIISGIFLVLLPVAANNNSATSVLRLQKAISVVNMRAEQRLQKQSRNVINSPSRIWEGMNIVWNKRGEKKKYERRVRAG